jgi:hypothetical protein
MADLIPSIFVIAGTLLVIGLIFWLTKRNKTKKEQIIRSLALQHGWEYEPVRQPLSWGYKLSSEQWTYEALSKSSVQHSDSGSSNISHTTTWHSESSSIKEGMVLVGPRISTANLGSFGTMLAQQAIRLMLGDEAGYSNELTEVQAGRASLRERYMVLARNENDAQQLLGMQVENLLLNWPGKQLPVIIQSSHGIDVKIQGLRVEKPEEIMAIVKLGNALSGN